MTIDERPDGTVLVTYDSRGLSVFMLAFSGLFVLVALYDLSIGTRGTARLVGLVGSATTGLLVAMVFLERAWFEFSPVTRVVTWRRRWALQQRSGTMPFDSIQSVLVDRPLGDEGTPSRRVTLLTTGGDNIPMTVGYRPDADDTIVRIAARIRAVLGRETKSTHLDAARALIAAGRSVEAVKLVRENEGLTLTEAKRRVERIQAGDERRA
jgi:hypothetical protein